MGITLHTNPSLSYLLGLTCIMFQYLPTLTLALQDGCSLLCIASFNGHLDVLKTLIEAGVCINQGDKVGY